MKWQEYISEIRKERPIVHCITNIVTVNDCANILHGIGALPVMAHHPMEVSEVTRKSNALVCNMGALEDYEAMLLAGESAKNAGHPVVIDPVGVAASEYRRKCCAALIEKVRPDCIRGNVSEINALVHEESEGSGVDAIIGELPDFEKINSYAAKIKTVIVISGKTDYICDGKNIVRVTGGSDKYKMITGSGCMSSVVMGAFLSVNKDAEAIAEACKMMKYAGAEAERRMKIKDGGTMTFRLELIDYLSMC